MLRIHILVVSVENSGTRHRDSFLIHILGLCAIIEKDPLRHSLLVTGLFISHIDLSLVMIDTLLLPHCSIGNITTSIGAGRANLLLYSCFCAVGSVLTTQLLGTTVRHFFHRVR